MQISFEFDYISILYKSSDAIVQLAQFLYLIQWEISDDFLPISCSCNMH